MSSKENLFTNLKYFGLEGDDAKIYLGLLQAGDVTVGSLSSKLDIDRGKTYRALEKLENLGLITSTLSNPKVCKAVNPEEALLGIIQKRRDEIITMEKLSNHIITVLQEVKHSIVDNSMSESVSIIQGRQNIYTRIGKMINESTSIVYLVSTIEDIMRMYHTSIPEMIEKSRKDGGIIRIITDGENKQAVDLIKKIGATETRHGKLPSSGRIVAEKNKQIIMSGSMKETMELNDEADSIIHTSSIEMVNNIFSLCEHLWEKSNQSISKKA